MNEGLRVAYTLEQCWHRVPGGTAVAAIEAARALLTRPEIELVGVAAAHARPPGAPWTPPVRTTHLRLPRPLLYEAWHRLRRPRVEAATGDVDVIHATTIAVPPRSRPLVVTIHDLVFLHHPEHFTRRGRSFFRRGLELALTDADFVLCSSRAVLDDCKAAGFAEERLRHVPLGVAISPVASEDVAAARRAHVLHRPYVMWAGTIEPRKNLPRLIAAFRALDRDVDLVLVGPTGWNEDLGALVRGIEDRVKVVGFVPARVRDALYAGAAVVCFPSLMEGFGFPVLEAMGQGVPVVTSSGTSTEELAAGAGLLVDPRDTQGITAALARILDDEGLAEELRIKGRERAAAYTWERTAAATAAVYVEAKDRA